MLLEDSTPPLCSRTLFLPPTALLLASCHYIIFLSGPELTTDGHLRSAISATLWSIQLGCIEEHCGQFHSPLPPHPLEALITSATFCFGWALLALPSSTTPRQPAATTQEDLPPTGVKDRRQECPAKTELCLSAFAVSSFRERWKPRFLEHSAIQTGTHNSCVCSYFRRLLHPEIDFLTLTKTECQE